MTRIVSLVPSATETLLAWGIEPVAVTRFCEQPNLRTVGGTKDPDIAAIVAIGPDLVVLCDEENRLEDAEALDAAGIRTHVVAIRSVADVAPQLAALAAAVGADQDPAPLALDPPASAQLRAFVPIWRRPWMTLNGDTYGSSVLEALGVANAFADEVERYPVTTLDAAADRRPAVALAPSEPYPFAARHLSELERVAPTVLVDGKDLFWWGVRTPDALRRLSTLIEGLAGAL